MYTMLESVTINEKLSLVEFRDAQITLLELSKKGFGNEEAIIIGALLQVLVVLSSRNELCVLRFWLRFIAAHYMVLQ